MWVVLKDQIRINDLHPVLEGVATGITRRMKPVKNDGVGTFGYPSGDTKPTIRLRPFVC